MFDKCPNWLQIIASINLGDGNMRGLGNMVRSGGGIGGGAAGSFGGPSI